MSDTDKKPSFDLVVREKFALVTEKINEWTDPGSGEKDENHYARLGWKVIVIGLGGFFLWATFAPLDKGVSATGYVITDSNRKTIQPSNGGVIDEILVREGQKVTAGQVLVKMNQVNAKAQANATKESIQGIQSQATNLEIAIRQKKEQATLLAKQLANNKELADEGFVPRNKVMEIERNLLQLRASIAEDEGNLLRSRQQIRELKERLNPYEFDLANTDVKSPVDGQVVNLVVFTKGGVVQPGAKLMEIVPTGESLIVEGQLPVHLIDKVYNGLEVEMIFTAFNSNRTPHIPGTLISVGGDRIVDEKTGQPYYKVQATTTEEGTKMLKSLKIRPGMPVELFVKTGEQSMMRYLLKPIFDRAHSAMRED